MIENKVTIISSIRQIYHLLGDVPDEPGRVQSHQPIIDGNLVERGALFVPEECVRYPHVADADLAKAHLFSRHTAHLFVIVCVKHNHYA